MMGRSRAEEVDRSCRSRWHCWVDRRPAPEGWGAALRAEAEVRRWPWSFNLGSSNIWIECRMNS